MSRRPIRRRRDAGTLAGPIGLVALAVAAVVFYVSYHALSGLPGQSHYRIAVDVPDAGNLNKSDEVRIGGLRIGQVVSVEPVAPRRGAPFSRLALQLDEDVRGLRRSTRVSVQTGSVLGANYVKVEPGRDGPELPEGGRLGLGQAGQSTQLTDLLDVFDRATSRNIQGFVAQGSAGLAGRGPDLNAAIEAFSALLPPLSRVSRTLAATGTDLPGFIDGADRTTAALASVTPQVRSGLRGGATTFGALADARRALQATLDAAPPAESATTRALLRVKPGLRATAKLFEELRPAAPLLDDALASADRTFVAGRPALAELRTFSPVLGRTAGDIRRFALRPSTDGAIRKTTELFTSTGPLIDLLAQAQLTCNLVGVWARNFSSGFGDIGFDEGPAIASIVFKTNGASLESTQSSRAASNLASNTYARNDATECESGNEPYTGQLIRANPAGLQPKRTADTQAAPEVLARARAAGLLDPEPR